MTDYLRFIPDLKDKIIDIVSILDVEQNWGLSYIDINDAWSHTKGKDVTVAVIDTGWFPHKDLIGNFKEGYDATGNNDYLDHGNYHSSHVSGVIAANSGPDSVGVTGIAPESKLTIIKSLDDSGCGSYDFIYNALKIAHDLNVDVINMSLGSPVNPGNENIHSIIKDIAGQGKIIVTAAGNDGGNVGYPAKYDEVVAVAAIDKNGNLAKFSSRGPELDAAAPGVQIYSTWGDNTYIKLDGTSMACPAIAGMIALIVSWMKTENQQKEINYKQMIKLLQQLGGDSLINMGSYNIAVPKFCNYTWK